MIGIGYSINRETATQEEKNAFIDWCNEHHCIYTSTNGVWTIQAPDESEERSHRLRTEKAELEAYLQSTDWMVVKCMELGLAMNREYPEEYVERQNARIRINEIEAELA